MKNLLISLLLVILPGLLLAQTGTEFWMAPPDVTYWHNAPGDEPIYFNVTAGSVAATVTISQPANAAFNGGAPIVLNIPANSAVRYNLTSLKTQLETRPTNTVCNTGLHIVSTANVTCYYESSNTNNPDIAALKGQNGLGTEFYIPLHKYAPFMNNDFGHTDNLAFASFDIVATEDNTTVLINPPVNVDGHAAGTPFVITLNEGQTYSCANTDLSNYTDPATHPSGAAVLSDKPIAINIKDDSDHNPSGGCYDLMMDQIVPVNILGTEYVAVKGSLNNNGDESLFLMAVENNTQVYIDGSSTPVATLFAGQYYRHDMDYLSGAANNATYVTSNKPLYAVHVTGFGCEMGMAILPPLNCAGSQQVGFTRSTNEGFFVNLLVRNGSQNDFVVTGPGTMTIPGSAFVTVPGTGGEWMAAHIQYDETQVPVNQAMIVTNTSDVFSLGIINGGSASGCRYGFFSEFSGEIEVNAGADQNRCATDSVHLAGTVSGGSTTGTWTSTGSGNFLPDATTLGAIYEPSIGDLALGSVTLTLTSTGHCTPVSDAMTVNFQAKPIPNAGVDQQVCTNNPPVALSGTVLNAVGGVWTGGAGTFLPANSDLNATYTPTAAEVASGSRWIKLTSTGNGVCSAVVDSMLVTFTPSPTADAGLDQVLCGNNANAALGGSVTVATGGIWSGGGTFDPSTTNMSASYTPSAAEIASGSATLTLTTTGNGNCNAVTDDVLLTFTAAPTANAGANSTACVNNADISLHGIVSVAAGGIWSGGTGIFTPDNASLNTLYSPSNAELIAGSVTLTLTTTGNGTCNPASSSRTITFTAPPAVNAGPDGTVCANAPAISLVGTVSGAAGGVWSGGAGSYSPNSSSLTTTYTPTAAEIASGSVTLVLSSVGNGTCNPVTDQTTWTFTTGPTANAGPDQVLCANDPDAALAGGFTIGTGAIWSGGSGSFDPGTTNMSATYTPTAAEISSGSVTLTLTTTGNGSCLAGTDQVELSFTPAPTANAGADASVCANNADIHLNGTVTVATGGIWSGGSGSYTPNNATLNATYTPTPSEIAAGTLTLTLTTTGAGNCTPVSDSRTITFTPAPVVDAGTNGSVCANANTIHLNGSVVGATGGVWSGGGGTYSPNNITLNASYVPSAAEISAGTVTLTLTSAGNGLCSPVSSSVTYGITPAPTVNAGLDQTLCGNNADANVNAAISVASGVQWSGGTGLYSPGSTAQNITYSPSPTEITNGSATLVATTVGNGACAAVTDAVTLHYTAAPIANAGPDQTVSSNNANTTLAGGFTVASGAAWSGGSGSFAPNNTTMNAVYTPSASEIASGSVTLTLTTTGNGTCSSATDQMTISFSAAPTADAGINQTVCANNPAVTLSGAVTIASGGVWSGGTGTYNPNNHDLNAVYMPSTAEKAAGSVTLTLTTVGNGNSNPVSDQVVITISPSPVVNAGTDLNVCANQPAAQLAGVVNNAAGGIWSGGSGPFDPGTSNLTPIYTPSLGEIATGTVTLTLTSTGNGLCNAVSDQVVVAIAPAPVVNAGVDRTVCVNNSNVLLAGSVNFATGGVWSGGTGGFSPSINALNAVYTPSTTELTAGSVTLTLTSTGNGNCLPVSDQMTIFFSQSPVVNAGLDRTVCANDPSVDLNGSVSVAGGGIWSGGGGSYTPNANTLNATYHPSPAEVALGTATLTLTSTGNGLCNAVSDAMTITINAAPTADAGANLFVCSNNAVVQLGGSVSGAGGGQWSGGAGSFTPSIAALNAVYTPTPAEVAAGSLTLTLTTIGNGFCQPVSDQVLITFTSPPTANAGVDGVRCANNAGIQLAGIVTVASGGAWSGAGGSFSPNANTLNATYQPSLGEIAAGSATLTLTTTGNNGCAAVTDNVTYTFSPSPTAQAGADVETCANGGPVALNGSVSIAAGGLWSGGNGAFTPNSGVLTAHYAPSLSEITAGAVTLTLTTVGNGQCNAVSDSMKIVIDPIPVVNAGPDKQICANNPDFQLNGFVGNATGGQWSGGAGTYFPDNNSLTVQYVPTSAEISSGSITLTLTSTGTTTCAPVTDQVTITFTGSPEVDAGTDLSVCANNTATQLNGDVSNASGGSWSGGSGTWSPSSNVLSPVYAPTAAEVAAGTMNLYLTSTGNGNCFAVKDTLVLVFTPAPTANAGADLSVCANNAMATLNGAVTVASGALWSGGLGTFSPNAQTLGAQYTPTPFEVQSGQVQLALTTTGNGNCLAVTDSITVQVTPAPVVDAGMDITTCSNVLHVPLAGTMTGGATTGLWSSSGTGSFSPDASDLNATYTASSLDSLNGSVVFTLTSTNNGLCDAVSDAVTVTVLPSATASAGPDQSICASEATVQLAGAITGNATAGTWTSTGSGTFSPDAHDPDATYQVTAMDTAAGSLTFTWSVNSCDHATDQMNVTIIPVSTVSAGTDKVTCFSDLDVVINGSVGGASATGTWSTLGSGSFSNPATSLSNIYQASAQDSLNTGVDLVLTATNTGSCAAAADTLHLSILPAGSVSAGPDLSFCANNATVQLAGTLSGDATQVHWTTSGTGSFYPSSDVLTPTYVPSNIDTAIGSLTLTLNAVNSCNNASDAMTLTLTPAPFVDAGPDQTYCDQVTQFNLNGTVSGITNVGQWSTTGTGTIANPGALNTTYTPSAADIAAGYIGFTLTSLNNGGCSPVSDEMSIYLTNGIVVSAGPNQSVCVLSDHANLQGTIQNGSPSGTWTSTGSGTFSPDADVLNAAYYFSPSDVANGSVVLTFTATNTGTCPSGSDQMTLTFGNTSYSYAGADQLLCANSPTAQLAGNYSGGAQGITWSTAGTGSFSNNTDPGATYSMSPADIAAGSVQLTLTTVTGGACTATSDAMILNVQPMPSISAGNDVIACTSGPIQLAANAANATGGIWTTSGTGTFLDPNALITLYYPSTADSLSGAVTLTVTSFGTAPCSTVSDAMTISFGGGLSAHAGSDVTACSTDPDITLAGTVSGTSTGHWASSGTGTFSPSAAALDAIYLPGAADYVIGNISLILTTTDNAGCPAAHDTMVVSYHVPPTVDAGADVLLCDGIQDIPLSATVQNAASVEWVSNGTGSFTPDAFTENATYSPSMADSIAGGVDLILTAYGTGTCGNAADTVHIGVGPTRIAVAGTDFTQCADGSPILLDGSITGVSGGTWTTNGTGTFLPDATALNASYVPSAPDLLYPQLNFVLTTTGNMGCPAHSDTAVVGMQHPPTVSAGPDVTTCNASADVQLAGMSTGAGGVLWSSTGTGSFVPDNTMADAVYQPSAGDSLLQVVHLVLTTTGNEFCEAVSDTLQLSFVNPLAPDFTVGSACVNGLTQFTDASTSNGASIIGWNWNFGNGSSGGGPQASTTYGTAGPYAVSLTIFAQNGCSASTTQTVTVMSAPVADFFYGGDTYTEVDIPFTDQSTGGASAWHYDFGDGSGSLEQEPTHAYTQAGQYIVVLSVSNAAGCSDSDSLLIAVTENKVVPPKLPDAFSPNGDGVNDLFYVRGGPFKTMRVKIYNGWGEQVFSTDDPTFGWDGTHNGVPEINGVYVYSVVAEGMDGKAFDRSGKVSLIR
jgi:gliding motility-associated-like protein